MAQIIWREEASAQLEKHIDYALAEFGKRAVKNWYRDIQRIESRMSAHPESFSLEPLLTGKANIFLPIYLDVWNKYITFAE